MYDERQSINVTIGQNIRNWRKRHSVTQVELSERMGLSQGYFSKIERGDKSPNLRTLTKLSAATGMPVRDIIGEH